MKFSEMPYARPDLNELKQQLQALTDRLKAAPDYAAAREAFLAQQKLSMHIDTLATLSSVRNSIDTRDKFYDAEEEFWNEAGPELRAYDDAWTAAMLESPFRKEFAAEYGDLMFLNAEIARKAFSPAIVEELKQENQLVQDYQKLIASAQIEFEGGTYTISQLSPFKNDPDDARRLAAWQAEGGWYKAHQPELDEIYDKLVRLRDAMGRKLGYDGYTQLGFIGAEEIPGVVRYVTGFLQGAEYAAEQQGLTVDLRTWFAGTYSASDDTTNRMLDWCNNGTTLLFVNGGNLIASAIDAAKETTSGNEVRVMASDYDQNDSSDLILGSAIKCYNSAVQQELYAFFSGNAAWDQTAADQSEKVGYTTGAVALAGPHWRFAELSQHDYERLYTQLRNSDLKVDAYADMNTLPDTPNVTVEEQN